MLLPLFGEIEQISNPKEFFDLNPRDLEEVVSVVRNGFGRSLDFSDIYKHVTSPEQVYLLRDKNIKAMASYNTKMFYGVPTLIVEGIALEQEVQGKGIFALLTDNALTSEQAICLRTQNPRMYRALEKFCGKVYPNKKGTPQIMQSLLREFAKYTDSTLDERGVVRGYYGSLFYGQEPTHCEISRFFKETLKMDLSKGDAVLAIGLRSKRSYGSLRGAWISDLD